MGDVIKCGIIAAKIVTDFGFVPKRDDLVQRGALLDAYDAAKGPPGEARSLIAAAPAVEAVPVAHARWIAVNPVDSLDPRMRCTACKSIEMPLVTWRHCPICGAKIDGGDDGDL